MKNVAIIMDGNGRWATSKLRPRVWGHIKGASIINSIAEEAQSMQLESLTLYAFSSENWSRPAAEVKALFKILYKFLKRNRESLKKNNIKFQVIGNFSQLDAKSLDLIKKTSEESRDNTGLRLIFAFGYGGRDEIVDAVNKFISENPSKKITKEHIQESLYEPAVGDIDLMIRTGGDQRISNFLLWQSAYSEIEFTQTRWPDFTPLEFREIIQKYSSVERRFGSLDKNASYGKSSELSIKTKKELV